MEDADVVRTYLDELVTISPLVKGVRRLIQSETDPMFVLQPDLLKGLQLLPDYGLSFDICIKQDQLANTVRMVRGCPETKLVLDHLAKPDVRAGVLDPWRDQLAELAALPNVVCKLSGLVTKADLSRWSPSDLQL